eukprot:10296897-Alexandrium_andersonii.AAC.1
MEGFAPGCKHTFCEAFMMGVQVHVRVSSTSGAQYWQCEKTRVACETMLDGVDFRRAQYSTQN